MWSLEMLEDQGFCTEADIFIQLPEDGMESQEDGGGEEDNNANHLSGNWSRCKDCIRC